MAIFLIPLFGLGTVIQMIRSTVFTLMLWLLNHQLIDLLQPNCLLVLSHHRTLLCLSFAISQSFFESFWLYSPSSESISTSVVNSKFYLVENFTLVIISRRSVTVKSSTHFHIWNVIHRFQARLLF